MGFLNTSLWNSLFFLLTALSIYMTFKLKGVQFRYFFQGCKQAFLKNPSSKGELSQFQSLMTALAATIGIGNIAGVATAVTCGGLGSLFWMVVISVFTMVIKYGEAVLAIHYRSEENQGVLGGPMYYLKRGAKSPFLAIVFATAGLFGTLFTGGAVQSNAIVAVCIEQFGGGALLYGAILTSLSMIVILGSLKWIAKVNAFLVPIMALMYFLASSWILATHGSMLLFVIKQIFITAFTGQAAVGGFVGSTMIMAIRLGISRGIFSNEAGLGTASIAAATAKCSHPCEQAIVSMIGGVVSTFVCLLTGLVLGVMQVIGTTNGSGIVSGAPLTYLAFEKGFAHGGLVVVIGAIFFGISTILGWAFYGERCAFFLFNQKGIYLYRFAFGVTIFAGCFLNLTSVWFIADLFNAFMALPNLFGLILLMPVIVQITKHFEDKEQAGLAIS